MIDARRRSSLTDADDQTLADRAADGDMRAFELLIRRYGPLMRAVSHRILGSTLEVDDVVQDTFITAWQQLPTLEDTSVVKSWLLRISTRKSIDRVRARKEHDDIADQYDQASTTPTPEDAFVATSRQEALTAALSQLPDDQRRTWVLREIAKYSYDEIATQLELPASTIRGLLSRARKNLMREMEDWR